ncbi:uncharacterized protein [Amphiura filiformis]|uniref:uncharacterized protein n=1 Tax=Amphiura filiformis TaxID=82378 RepID=UPI003B219449
MDVIFGHCWRCENAITREVNCRQCGVAKYCSDTCCHRDQYRHQPYMHCISCNEASYCGKMCQKAHWKDHKHKCRERAQEIRMKGAALQSYFKQRRGIPLAVPYYFGNTLAVDMLNVQANECSSEQEPDDKDPLKSDYFILSAGCGNLRNWIHTVASLPAEFSGKLHTFLNDFDPFVQARNVLQLYMMVMHRDEDNIATSITNIYYSLKLSAKDYNLLVNCLTALQDLTATGLNEMTGGVIRLTDADMAPMREVWQSWLNLECRKGHPNYIDLHKQRQEGFRNSPDAAEGIKVYKTELPDEFVQSYDDYLATGNLQPLGSKRGDLQYDNPTLTGYRHPYLGGVDMGDVQRILASPKKLEFVYCIGEDMNPFGSWDYLKVKKSHYNRSMIVMFHGYITDQIQQVLKCLKAGLLTVSFVVWNCLELSVRLNPELCKVDRIFTSNMADYAGTQPLLKVMTPYLNRANKCSVIVTQYRHWYALFPDARITSPETAGEDRIEVMSNCIAAAVKDTHIDTKESSLNNPRFMSAECKKAMARGSFFFQEYFNYMVYFVNYLRAEYVAFNEPLEDVSDELQNVVNMQNAFEHLGLGRDVACIPKAASLGASATKVPPPPPSFKEVKHTEGLKLRDFRRGELNKVAPYRYRRNVRRVNLLRGMQRMLEWYIP